MNKEEIQIQIQQFSEKLYERGYSDGQKDWHNLDVERDKAYKKGLDDAYEATKKIILGVNNGGLTDDEIITIFNKPFTRVLVENTAAEVVTKIQEYERSNYDTESAGELMDFPDTFDEFVEQNAFKDTNEVYTNGIELIPVFRVRQWIEHTTGMMMDSLKVEEGKSCRRCFWDKYRDAQHPTGNPCDSCIDFSNFSPETEPEEQIKVGDGVVNNHCYSDHEGVVGVVSYIYTDNKAIVLYSDGTHRKYHIEDLTKTEDSYPELLQLFDKLKGKK